MVVFKTRILLCLIWDSIGTQLPRIHASQFLNFDTQELSKLVREEQGPAIESTSGITMVRSRRTVAPTAAPTDQQEAREAREAAVMEAVKKVKGTSQAAELARELLEQECPKALEKQEAEDAAFVQKLIEEERKAKQLARAEAATWHDEAVKQMVQRRQREEPSEDEEYDETPALHKRITRKEVEEEYADEEDIFDLETPPKSPRKKHTKHRSDSESDSSPEVFAKNPNKVCTGILNYKKKAHHKIYEAATKTLFADTKDRYDMDVIGATNLLQKITDRCSDLGLGILKVPASKQALRDLIGCDSNVPTAKSEHLSQPWHVKEGPYRVVCQDIRGFPMSRRSGR